MSDHGNDHNKLKELLNKNSSGQPVDDFEKDALAGFAMLGSEEEALKLKQQLDERIYPEVLSEKGNSYNRWLAAAGLLLVVGLTVFFVRTRLGAPAKGLAMANASRQQELSAPSSLPVQSEARPVIEAPANKKNEATPVIEQAHADKQASDFSEKTAPGQQPGSVKGSGNESTAALAKKNKTYSKKEPLPAAPLVAISNAGPESEKDMEAMSPVSAAEEQSDKKRNADEKPQLQRNAIKLNLQQKMPNAHAPAGQIEDLIKTDCIYAGGDVTLKNDLKAKLSAKNVLQKFDAALSINKNNVVKQVKLTAAYALTKEQQQQVIKILKSLDKFSVLVKTDSMVTYSLAFRP